ncbi:MAG: transglutaminase-like domain-containing protein, partial [Promethearchaeota archaeon]
MSKNPKVRISKTQRQNIVKLMIVTSLILGGYSLNTVIYNKLFNTTHFPVTEEGNKTESQIADLTEIDYDFQKYLDALFNSSYFENLNASEQFELLSNLVGNETLQYLADENMSAEEFMDQYGDELGGMFESLGGGESFDSSMLDSFPPELAAALLARPMFYTIESNPSSNPWNNPTSTLFKIAAYDYYNTTDYDWDLSDTINNQQSLVLQSNSDEEKWKIKYPIMASPQVTTGLPSISPDPRVLEYSPGSSPLSIPSVDLKEQVYMGGLTGEASYSSAVNGQFTNLTYNLLYNSADYQSASYYQNLEISMAEYTGGDLGVLACMKGPGGASDWDAYRSTHPYFNTAASELEATSAFINANNIYDKTQAVIDYVGANFVYNVQGNSRPGDGEDPIEWLSETRESKYPFEITSLTVALARLEGLSVRYVSGYKWDDYIAAQLGGSYSDPTEGGLDAYTYRIANSYTWLEVFIPATTSTGEWVEFDNHFTATPTPPTSDSMNYILKFDGSYNPNPAGYDRGTIATPTQINIEVDVSFNGNPMNALPVEIKDISYNKVLDTVYT